MLKTKGTPGWMVMAPVARVATRRVESRRMPRRVVPPVQTAGGWPSNLAILGLAWVKWLDQSTSRFCVV